MVSVGAILWQLDWLLHFDFSPDICSSHGVLHTNYVVLQRSVLLVEESRIPGGNHKVIDQIKRNNIESGVKHLLPKLYYLFCLLKFLRRGCRMLNATFSNVSVITWQSFLLVEEFDPEKTTDRHNVVSSTSRHERYSNLYISVVQGMQNVASSFFFLFLF